MSNPLKPGLGAVSRKALIFVGILCALGVGSLLFCGDGTDGFDIRDSPRAIVERTDMVVTLLQTGEMTAKESNQITNETQQSCKITFVIDDGAQVEKGDLLLELESSELTDTLMGHESLVSSAESELEHAKKQLEISQAKQDTDLASAELKVELAALDLKKYIEAEFPQEVRKAELEITLAEEELSDKKNRLEWTRRLFEKGYTNKQDLDSDELAVRRKEIELVNKKEELRILREYTYPKELKRKRNDVTNAEAEVVRLKKTFEAERSRNLAQLESRKTQLEMGRSQLKKVKDQLDHATVYSEYDGMVFHPKFNRWENRRIEKGETVHPRQKILEFPDLSAFEIKIGVPESIIERVRVGQKAVATVDAIPDLVLDAEVGKVGVVPDSRRWFDANTKTYTVTLDIPTTPTAKMKPGMSVVVEIIVNELKDVLVAPIQAVTSRDGKQFVYVVEGGDPNRVEVRTGDHNEDMIEIVEGIEEGDELLLYAPVNAEKRSELKAHPLDRVKNGEKNSNGAGV